MKASAEQTVIDICINQHGTLEALFAFADGNGLALDQEVVPGQELKAVEFIAPADTLAAYEFTAPSRQNTTTTSTGQSLIDLAVQEAGDLAGLFELLSANNLTLESELAAGTELKLPEDKVQNRAMREYFRSRAIRVNTGTTYEQPVIVEPDNNKFDYTFNFNLG